MGCNAFKSSLKLSAEVIIRSWAAPLLDPEILQHFLISRLRKGCWHAEFSLGFVQTDNRKQQGLKTIVLNS